MRAGLIGVVVMVGCGGEAAPPGAPDGATASADAAPGPRPDAAPALGCAAPAAPLDATWDVAGRDVWVHVPASVDPAAPTPVVIALHGLTSSGEQLIDHSQLLPVSDAEGFITVLPDGTGSPRSWNAGACCAPASSSGVDDVAFLAALLDEVEARLCVEPRRIYVTGFSNGAFLAYRAACALADRIAAIGPVSGQLGVSACTPGRPVPVMHVHGTNDLIVPYDGGGLSDYPSVDDTLTTWRALNGCAATSSVTYQAGDATCVAYDGCAADVHHCVIDGGGHQWPGGESNGPFGGHVSDDLDAGAALWAFFADHPLPP